MILIFVMINVNLYGQEIECARIVYHVFEGNYSNKVNSLGANQYVNTFEVLDDDYQPKSIVLEFKNNKAFSSISEESTMGNNNWSAFKEESLEVRRQTFYDLYKKELLEVKELQGQEYIIARDIENIEWTFFDTSKRILGYNCYKATRSKSFKNGSGKLITINYVAWYTTDIFLEIGPFEHIKLPGLVLELEKIGGNTEFKYTALSVEQGSCETINFNRPTKGNQVKDDEYRLKAREVLKKILGIN